MGREQVLACRLRAARQAHGWSQRTLATLVGISRRQVQDYEAGREVPGSRILTRLCLVLQVTSDSLLGLTEAPPPASHGEMEAILAQLSPANQAWLLGFAKTLVEEERAMRAKVRQWKKAV
jgi:transcriptional regulator with XRE-family HTH domain